MTCLIIATSVGIPQEKTSPKKAKAQRHDAEGFALPEGAVARLGTLRGVDDEPIEFLALSADGKKVATLPHEPNPTLRIREVPSGKLLREIPLDIEHWRSAALSPDFQKLAWSYLDNSVSVVELATGKQTVLNKPTKGCAGIRRVLFQRRQEGHRDVFASLPRPGYHKKGRKQSMDQPVRF